MLLARMVGNQTTASSHTCADHGALWPAYQSADNRTANSRSANDLGLRVVMGVMFFLHVLGVFILVTVLRLHA